MASIERSLWRPLCLHSATTATLEPPWRWFCLHSAFFARPVVPLQQLWSFKEGTRVVLQQLHRNRTFWVPATTERPNHFYGRTRVARRSQPCVKGPLLINTVRSGNAIRQHRCWSTLVQLLACQTTPSHYLARCYLIANQRPLQWCHNGRDSISNHQPHNCLLNRLFRCRSKKTSKFRVTGLCAGNSPVSSEFPAQKASNVENVFIWWRHHALKQVSVKFELKIHQENALENSVF